MKEKLHGTLKGKNRRVFTAFCNKGINDFSEQCATAASEESNNTKSLYNRILVFYEKVQCSGHFFYIVSSSAETAQGPRFHIPLFWA